MLYKKAIIIIFAIVSLVPSAYFFWFGAVLDYVISSDVGDWGVFGDYIGGLLNPILAFISSMLILATLLTQKKQLYDFEKNENIKIFESHFFRLIEIQKSELKNLKNDSIFKEDMNFNSLNEAIISLEEKAEAIIFDDSLDEGVIQKKVSELITALDRNYIIYDYVRTFKNTAILVSDKLSDKKGFNPEIRKEYYETLISYTGAAMLRLICLYCQFKKNNASRSVMENLEFKECLESKGLGFDIYKKLSK